MSTEADKSRDPMAETEDGSLPSEDEAQPYSREMPFLDHLEELRWRIVKCLVALAIGIGICGGFSERLLGIILGPGRAADPPVQFINTHPLGMFLVRMYAALVGGLILSLPIIVYQIWMFVAPGLYKKERRYIWGILLSTMVCFLSGASLAYFGAIPTMLKFLVGMGTYDVKTMLDIRLYARFVIYTIITFGLVFEMPVVAFVLARVGILTAPFMRHIRPYAYVGIFVLAAVATPSPDPFSQLMLAIPICVLYEGSIFLALIASK